MTKKKGAFCLNFILFRCKSSGGGLERYSAFLQLLYVKWKEYLIGRPPVRPNSLPYLLSTDAFSPGSLRVNDIAGVPGLNNELAHCKYELSV